MCVVKEHGVGRREIKCSKPFSQSNLKQISSIFMLFNVSAVLPISETDLVI